jgi:predicted dehydrogenase
MGVRWGIIGCGDVCEVKSGPPLYKARGSELSIVMRRDRGRAKDFAQRHGISRFTDSADEVISDPGVDAVYVATPPGSHCQYALRVAQAGKPCYVEKPMARSAAECEAMLQAFERAGQPLYVAYYRRCLPRFTKVADLLGQGVLGELLSVSHVYQGRAQPGGQPPAGPVGAAGWRQQAQLSGGGLFVDLGSHVVDLIDFLLGPLQDVAGLACHRSSGGSPAPGAVEDTVVASFRSGCGALGTLRYQFHTANSADVLELVGTRGVLSLSVFGTEPLRLQRGDELELLEVDQPEHVQMPLLQSIVDDLVSGGDACPSTGRSALRAAQVVDRVLDGFYGGRADAFWERPETWPGLAG